MGEKSRQNHSSISCATINHTLPQSDITFSNIALVSLKAMKLESVQRLVHRFANSVALLSSSARKPSLSQCCNGAYMYNIYDTY